MLTAMLYTSKSSWNSHPRSYLLAYFILQDPGCRQGCLNEFIAVQGGQFYILDVSQYSFIIDIPNGYSYGAWTLLPKPGPSRL